MTDPSPAAARPPPWFVRGDVDGFFGLALDNLVQLLRHRRALPRRARLSGRRSSTDGSSPAPRSRSLVGNLFYAWQAIAPRPAHRARPTSAPCPTASTPSRSSPTSSSSCSRRSSPPQAAGAADPAERGLAGRARRLPRLGADRARRGARGRADPARHAARRAALARWPGIALTFISLGFLLPRLRARRSSGFATLAIVVLVTYFGRRPLPRRAARAASSPSLLGTLLAWATGHRAGGRRAGAAATWSRLPVPVVGDLLAARSPRAPGGPTSR